MAPQSSLTQFTRYAGAILLLTALIAMFQFNARLTQLHSGAAGTSASFAQPQMQPPVGGERVVLDGESALAMLRRSRQQYIIADVRNGLGNRLRALASAMSLADSLGRPMLVVWVPDLHCNCSISSLYSSLPFQVVEEPVSLIKLSHRRFQVYNYMRGELGAFKEEPIEVDPDRHLYFRSAYVMNHPAGKWDSGGPQQQIKRLRPVSKVQRMLVADRSMVGLHVRNVFDAPRDAKTNVSVEGASAVHGAEKEYGKEISDTLLQWRRASHWTNFAPRIASMIREQQQLNATGEPIRFYLAADSDEAYIGLTERFPNNMLYTRRPCEMKRCDFRDCECALRAACCALRAAQAPQHGSVVTRARRKRPPMPPLSS